MERISLKLMTLKIFLPYLSSILMNKKACLGLFTSIFQITQVIDLLKSETYLFFNITKFSELYKPKIELKCR